MLHRDFAGKGLLAVLLAGALPAGVLAGEKVTYTYDALGRVKIASSDGTINDGYAYSWCYDDAGNRTLARTDAAGVPADCSSVAPPPPPPPSAPSISVNDTGNIEGANLQFNVTLSAAHSSAISVTYATATGTASSGDFSAANGTLTFAAGEQTKTVWVQAVYDTYSENTETFTLNLSNATGGASIADAQGTGLIFDGDPFDPCGGQPCQ